MNYCHKEDLLMSDGLCVMEAMPGKEFCRHHYHEKLESQNTELKALVRELVEACEFYADPENWNPGSDDFACDYDYEQFIKSEDGNCGPAGGKRSREVLSKNKELIEAIKGE